MKGLKTIFFFFFSLDLLLLFFLSKFTFVLNFRIFENFKNNLNFYHFIYNQDQIKTKYKKLIKIVIAPTKKKPLNYDKKFSDQIINF